MYIEIGQLKAKRETAARSGQLQLSCARDCSYFPFFLSLQAPMTISNDVWRGAIICTLQTRLSFLSSGGMCGFFVYHRSKQMLANFDCTCICTHCATFNHWNIIIFALCLFIWVSEERQKKNGVTFFCCLLFWINYQRKQKIMTHHNENRRNRCGAVGPHMTNRIDYIFPHTKFTFSK